jgi:hypothetical protein
VTAWYLKQGDRLPVLDVLLKNSDGTAVNLSGATARFLMRVPWVGTVKTNAAAAIVDAAAGRVQYAWADADVDTAATYEGEIEVTFSDGRKQTFPSEGYITVVIAAQVA